MINYRPFFLFLLFFFCGCQHHSIDLAPPSDSGTGSMFSSGDVVEGMFRIKLGRATANNLRVVNTRSQGVTTQISALDELCSKYNIVRIERIFPPGEMEARTRKAGLDLWYNVYFNADGHSAEQIAGEFSRLQGITHLEPVRRITKAGSVRAAGANGNPVPTPAVTKTSAPFPYDDPFLPEQWDYYNDGSIHPEAVSGADINLLPVWKTCGGNPDVIVAVVDEGVQYNHPDLEANMWEGIGYNFYANNSKITWGEGHGTHVAGTIAAVSNNGTGISGIAGGTGHSDGVKIMSCEIFNEDGNSCSSNGCAQAIKYGADHGAVISQNSWGYDAGAFSSEAAWKKEDRLIQEAIDYFITYAGMDSLGQTQTGPMAGGVVIFAAGNEASKQLAYPGAYPPCINVAAISCSYQASWYTNYNNSVDICATGGGSWYSLISTMPYEQGYILSTLPTNLKNGDRFWDGEKYYTVDYVKTPGYGYMQGTSMACPHVSGVAALIVSEYGGPGFTNDQLKDILFNSARDIDSYQPYNYKSNIGPLLDAGRAFAYCSGDVPAPEIIPAEGQSNHLHLLDYETARLTFTLRNYTGYTLTGEAGQIAHTRSGDQIEVAVNASAIIPGIYTATLTARNLSYSSNYTIHYTVEQNCAPENTCTIPALCFSGSGITQTLNLRDYFTDPNEDISQYSVTVVPEGLFQTHLAEDRLQITSTGNGTATIRITASDRGRLSASAEFQASTDTKTFRADFYPNPCKNILHVKPGKIDGLSVEAGNVSLLTPTGTEVFRQYVRFSENQAADLDLSSLPGGKYLLTLSCRVNNREMISTQTLLKQ